MFLLDLNAIPPQPWKNGGGTTRELASFPNGAGLDDFLWRASVAEVAADGPFSIFPGIDRSIMLLNGAGMQLDFADGRQHLLTKRYEPFLFRGEDQVEASLRAGPTLDFNLMLRRDAAQARLDVFSDAGVLEPADESLLLFSLAGSWRARLGNATHTLGAGQALVKFNHHPAVGLSLLEGGSALLCLRLVTQGVLTHAA